ncbi:hypothetical protein ACHMW4_28705 [Mesorhizobium sp. UC22_110]|uniref:hypothetical protein n=1 Tax=unclassified Mesorhizobium TaxID=325217 RepID=UPI0036708D5E
MSCPGLALLLRLSVPDQRLLRQGISTPVHFEDTTGWFIWSEARTTMENITANEPSIRKRIIRRDIDNGKALDLAPAHRLLPQAWAKQISEKLRRILTMFAQADTVQ